jgi:hypothetical protein
MYTNQLKLMEQIKVTWPVILLHPVIQDARADCSFEAIFAEK